MYKRRFENLARVAKKFTSSLNIGDILEMIRDEGKATIPELAEVCLLIVDSEALNYTRPLHCAMGGERINCQLCKRGRETVAEALGTQATALCFLPGEGGAVPVPASLASEGLSEIVLPIYHNGEPLAVFDAIAKPGQRLGQAELILLKDLTDLAHNVIINARSHWKMAQERLTVDRILEHLRPFVPATVQKIVEKDPNSPSFEKVQTDVSTLFLDVAGYTRISENLTRDKVNFIIEKYFSSFLDLIYEHGGDINETAGDGLMIIFQGEPNETAINAARAALKVRDKTREINEELRNRFQPISVNMGINSGEASVGMSRFQGKTGMRMTFTATGPVTNLAARIASAAKDGDILIGAETAARISHEISVYDRGSMNFKNVSEPVQVFSLVRPDE
jgi:class 3 adenylate cyclase